MIFGRQRQHAGDDLVGAVGIGIEHAGDEAHVSPGRFRIVEGADPAEAAHEVGHARRLRLRPVGADPFERGFARDDLELGRRGHGRARPGASQTETQSAIAMTLRMIPSGASPQRAAKKTHKAATAFFMTARRQWPRGRPNPAQLITGLVIGP